MPLQVMYVLHCVIFWIGFLMAAGKQKRGLHDRISETEVKISTPNWRKHNTLTRKDA